MASDRELMNLKKASQVVQLDSHTYEGKVLQAWCFRNSAFGGLGLVPLMGAIKAHFSSTHANLNQPDTISLHIQFLRQVPPGNVKIKIDDVKIGRAFSNVHVTMMDPKGQKLVVAYVVQSNLAPNGGYTADTGVVELLPKLPPKSDLQTLVANKDLNWVEDYELQRRHPVLAHHHLFFEREPSGPPGVQARWLRFRDEVGSWTPEAIPYAADIPGPRVLSPLYNTYWFASLSMSIQIKKRMPENGLEWLLSRCTISSIEDGKLDFNSTLFDEQGNIVAISTQILAALAIARRTTIKKSNL